MSSSTRETPLIFAVGRLGPSGISLLGTAFVVAPGRLATAAHVTQQNDTGLCLVLHKITSPDAYQDTTGTTATSIPAKIISYDPVRDIAVLQVDATFPVPYAFGSSDDVSPGTRIVSFGFPHADYQRLVLTRQDTTVGARILLGCGPIKAKHIVMNVLTRPGQSGSPVFIADRNVICAMVIGNYTPLGTFASVGGITPHTLHQTTHALSAEYLREML